MKNEYSNICERCDANKKSRFYYKEIHGKTVKDKHIKKFRRICKDCWKELEE
jgi:nitrate/TMAO reductase-like tetraheme cytochrome c subunit